MVNYRTIIIIFSVSQVENKFENQYEVNEVKWLKCYRLHTSLRINDFRKL